MKPKPKSMSLYRAKLACKIARDACEGKCELPDKCDSVEYAIYNLAHAIEDIACHLDEVNERKEKE